MRPKHPAFVGLSHLNRGTSPVDDYGTALYDIGSEYQLPRVQVLPQIDLIENYACQHTNLEKLPRDNKFSIATVMVFLGSHGIFYFVLRASQLCRVALVYMLTISMELLRRSESYEVIDMILMICVHIRKNIPICATRFFMFRFRYRALLLTAISPPPWSVGGS